jgi:chitinase
VTTTSLAGTSWSDAAVSAGTTYVYEVTATGPGGTGPASVAVSATVPAAAPPPTTSAAIYTDALAAGWQDWSWATVNLASASPVASGTRAIAVTFPAWGGLYLRRTTATITGLTTLTLSVNGGATAGAHLWVVGVQGTTQTGRVTLNGYCAGGVIPQNAWAACQVPLSALGPAGTAFDGFQVQEADGLARPVMYVDDVSLSGATTVPPALPAAPTGVAATGSTGSVRVSWSAVTGATGYGVLRATQLPRTRMPRAQVRHGGVPVPPKAPKAPKA